VTGSSAARLLLPCADTAGREALLAHAWRASAGFFAVTALRFPAAAGPLQGVDPEPPALVDAAIGNGAVHAIKFTEACLREWRVAADPILLRAAADGVRRLNA